MDTIVGFPSPADGSTEPGFSLGSVHEFLEGALAARPFEDAPVTHPPELVEKLTHFVGAPDSARVLIISGRASSGKTTLLAALAEHVLSTNESAAVRFASDVVSAGAPQAPRLPKGPCVIVIDDAHRQTCTTTLVHLARERTDVRFVLTTRPAGAGKVSTLLMPLRLSPEDLTGLPRLADDATNDDDRALLQEQSYDALLSRIATTVDPKLLAGVLGLVAALAPVRTSDERFLQGASELLGCRRRDVVSALRVLEHARVVDRSAQGSSVIPSALGDVVLVRLLADPAPLSGSIAERARAMARHFGLHALAPLLRNAGEMDSPYAMKHGASEFVAELFGACRDEFERGSPMERLRLLAALREVALDQPAGMLDLAEAALQLRPDEDASLALSVFLSGTSVTNELPAILQKIALNPAHFHRAADLLWQLGRDDLRLQSPHPDHPMRVLRDFAAGNFSRPVGFHERLLNAVDRWLLEPGAHEHKHSPLDVLDTFLAESDTETEEGDWVTRQVALRNQALHALARAASSANRRAALSGVSGLESVLTNASVSSAIGFPEPAWRNRERLEVLEMLRQVATDATDPLVHFAVADVFRWAAYRTTDDTIRAAAGVALGEIPESTERRLYEALTQRPPTQRAMDGEIPPSSAALRDQRNNQPRGTDDCRFVVNRWIWRAVSATDVVEQMGQALDTLSLAGKSGSPRLLLQVLSLTNAELASTACEVIMKSPEGPLGPHVAALLHTLRESAPDRATELIGAIVQDQNATLCASLAQAFAKWVDRPRSGDREVLRELLAHRDGFVRRAALGALRTMAKSASRDALTLAVDVNLAEGPEVAETLFGALDAGKLFTDEALAREDVVAFLSRLTDAPSLDGHSTMRFLHFAGKRHPQETANLFVDRLQRAAQGGAADFAPLPPEGLSLILSRVAESPEWSAILRRIRNLVKRKSSVIRMHATQLFHAASKNYSPAALEVLSEWVQMGSGEELEAVAVLLEEAPASFLFSHVNLVATLLRRSHAQGGALFDTVQHTLLSIATRPRAGAAHPSEASLRAQAREAAAKLAPRSPEQRFFETIVKHTESLLAEEKEADHDDLFDL